MVFVPPQALLSIPRQSQHSTSACLALHTQTQRIGNRWTIRGHSDSMRHASALAPPPTASPRSCELPRLAAAFGFRIRAFGFLFGMLARQQCASLTSMMRASASHTLPMAIVMALFSCDHASFTDSLAEQSRIFAKYLGRSPLRLQ